MAIPEARRVQPLALTALHPAYDGHFPGMPILPGAVLLDEALRLIGADRRLDLTEWQISAAKFLKIVRPGDTLRLEHGPTAGGAVRFEVHAADHCVLVGTLSHIVADGPG